MKFFEFFVDNKKFTTVLGFFVLFFGVSGLINLSSESFPTVNIGQVIITTVYDGATASDIETKITKPIEDEIRKVSGIKEVRSVSQPSLSTIYTDVDIDNYAVEKVVADLQRAIDRATGLPNDLRSPPSFLEIKSEEFPVIELAIIGFDSNRKRSAVAEELKEDLEDNKDIVSITLNGFQERQLNVLVDPEALDRYHVSLAELSAKIGARNQNFPGGFVESDSKQTLLRVEGKVTSAQELSETIIRSNFSGQTIYLKDLATVEDSKDDPTILARHGGVPASFLVITKKGGSDLVKLAVAIEEKLESFRQKYDGEFKFKIFNNEGRRVSKRLNVLSSNAVLGLILVVTFLLVFLPGRSGFMASLSLPLAVLATLGYMSSQGFTLNTLTIIALIIALGMLVDNSVVISENFNRLKGEGMSSRSAALESVGMLWLPITVTALTTISAFLPMLVTTGMMGQFIKYIPMIVTASLIISLLESFILLPTRLASGGDRAKSNKKKPKQDWFQKRVIPGFTRIMTWLVRYRYLSSFGFFMIIVIAFYLLSLTRFNLFPADQTEVYIARVETERGTTIEETDRKLAEIANAAQASLGSHFAHITSRAGADQVGPNDPKAKIGENVGQVMFFVTDEVKDNVKTPDMLEKLRSIPIPAGTNAMIEAVINGPPVGEPVNAIFRSTNAEQLEQVVTKVKKALDDTNGVYDATIDDVYGDQEVVVELDYAKADRLGLDPTIIGQTIRTAFAGLRVSDTNIDDDDVDLMIRLNTNSRVNLNQLSSLKIGNNRGDLVPLKTIAKFEQAQDARFLKRVDYKPARTVTASIDERTMTVPKANAVVDQTFASISKDFPEVSLTFSGAGKNTQDSVNSLFAALVLSLIGIFALLVFLFKSYSKPVLVMSTIPMGFLGISIAFNLHNLPLSFMALVGIVGLGGIIVNSGIVLISFIEELRKRGAQDLHTILVQASGMRLRAVVVTAFTTISGLLPTAYGIGGSDEFIIPMTMSMAWGMVSGTILALLWVPVGYAILEDITFFWNRVLAKLGIVKKEEAGSTPAEPTLESQPSVAKAQSN